MPSYHWLDGETVFEESIDGSRFTITCDGKRKSLVGELRHGDQNFALSVEITPGTDALAVIDQLRAAARLAVSS